MTICKITDDTCIFNSTHSLKRILHMVHLCSRQNTCLNQFAAVDTFIERLDLPYVHEGMLMAPSPSKLETCVDTNISSISTLIAIVGSYRNLSNIFIFCDSRVDVKDVIRSVNAVRSSIPRGTTCIVQSLYQQDGIHHTLTYANGDRVIQTNDEGLSYGLQRMSASPNSMSYYMSQESSQYSTFIKGIPGHMWINAVSDTTGICKLIRSEHSRILPMFYSDAKVEHLASVNFGGQDRNTDFSIGDTEAKLNSVVAYMLNATTKFRKCYYCSYFSTLHDKFCPNVLNSIGVKYQFQFAEGIVPN